MEPAPHPVPESPGDVLIVDDDPRIVSILVSVMEDQGFRAEGALSAEEGLERLKARAFDMAFVDLKMPGKNGIEMLTEIKDIWPATDVVICTGQGNIEIAVTAMKAGATDFVVKPFTIDMIRLTTQRVVDQRKLRLQNQQLRELSARGPAGRPVIAHSPAIRNLMSMIPRAAESGATILLTGETGTGKEVIARAIHQMGPRRDRPFVPLDCAAIPENLLESEFFGHKKGAFTGADYEKPGMVELADTGTLFLDEIGEMSLGLQAKILRLLQERTYRRIGGTQENRANVHVIAATNRNLPTMVNVGTFRRDLMYRLQVLSFHVPPLRDRVEDILPLAEEFLRHFCRKNQKHIIGFTEGAVRVLTNYKWPGNVRELENAIERAVIFAEGQKICIHDLRHVPGAEVQEVLEDEDAARIRLNLELPGGLSLKDFRDQAVLECERLYAERLLALSGGNVTLAAQKSGVSRRTFHRLINRTESGSPRKAENPAAEAGMGT